MWGSGRSESITWGPDAGIRQVGVYHVRSRSRDQVEVHLVDQMFSEMTGVEFSSMF